MKQDRKEMEHNGNKT